MENREQQILSEIRSLMTSVRAQLEQLDAKVAQLQQIYEPQELDPEPIDLELDDFPFVLGSSDDISVTVVETAAETVVETAAETVVETEVETSAETIVETANQDDMDLEMDAFFAPDEIEATVSILDQSQSEKKSTAVIDVMATKHAWRTDMPGSPVKDVRAAIALVDRALFINTLFEEDAMSFLDTLNHINQASTLDEAVGYLAQTHPEWDFDSDVVYRFMMAVRRKIN